MRSLLLSLPPPVLGGRAGLELSTCAYYPFQLETITAIAMPMQDTYRLCTSYVDSESARLDKKRIVGMNHRAALRERQLNTG